MIVKRAATAVALMLLLAPPAAPAPQQAKVGKVMVTYYWIIDENAPRYRGGPEVALRDTRGRVIAHVTRKFRKALVCEGTGWLRDGRVVVYECKRNGEHRFRFVKAKSGVGVTGRALVPYRTVAVDPHFIKMGSTIYIPQLKGAKLPDGTTHDGMFTAADRGHFRGRHIDIFVGEGARGAGPFVRRGYGSRSHVTVYLVSSPPVAGRS